jgi:hypothetical protein
MDVKVIPNSDDYRDGWDRIWGKREGPRSHGNTHYIEIWPVDPYRNKKESDNG